MTSETEKLPTPQMPAAGTDLRRLWNAGAELARIALFMKSRSDIASENRPNTALMHDIYVTLQANNFDLPEKLPQALGCRP